jgi:uncharacterized protein YchJ
MGAIKEHYHDEIEKGQREAARKPHTNTSPKPVKPGRNSICPCGSGKKFKNCCELGYRLKLQKHIVEERTKQKK